MGYCARTPRGGFRVPGCRAHRSRGRTPRRRVGGPARRPARRVVAQGRARREGVRVASRISATLDLAVVPQGEGSDIVVSGRYEITGRIATLGAGAIRKKGDKVL